MVRAPDSEDIFFAFTAEPDMTPEVFRSYVARYPHLAADLADLYHEFQSADFGQTAEEEVSLTAASGLMDEVQTALSGDRLISLARTLGLPRDFIAGFRDARVRAGTIPLGVLSYLSRAADVRVHHILAYFRHAENSHRALAFKSDSKPRATEIMDYADFVRNLGLTDEEEAKLRELEHSDGSD